VRLRVIVDVFCRAPLPHQALGGSREQLGVTLVHARQVDGTHASAVVCLCMCLTLLYASVRSTSSVGVYACVQRARVRRSAVFVTGR
jgi:hypothetical protein